jgi:hypothetical protein
VKPAGCRTPARSSASVTAGHEPGSGQYPVDRLLTSHTPTIRSRQSEGHLLGGEDILSAGAGAMFAAAGRQPERTIEVNDERDSFGEFTSVLPSEPAVEQGWRVRGNSINCGRLVA